MTETIVTLEYEETPVEIINTFIFPIVRQDFIIPALKSLKATTPQNYKTIIVNQTQPNPEFEREIWDMSDIVIHTHLNYGFAQASNIATRIATTEYVTIANDDIIFLPNWWEGIIETFEKFETALIVSPRSLKEPGWGYNEPEPRVYLELLDAWQHPEKVQALVEEQKGAVIDGLVMWCVTMKRKEWVELGTFDERFFPGGGEDYCGSARAYQAGYRAIATGLSWVWHHWGKSKDDEHGFDVAMPDAREYWNKLSTKGFGDEGLWHPDVDCWGVGCVRTDPVVHRAPL